MRNCQSPLQTINLDHAATTKPEPTVVEAMCRTMLDCDANPSAAYRDAGSARAVLRTAKTTLGAMLGVTPQELYFTGGGTESNNWALRQAAGRHVVLSAIEHKSVLLAAENQGCQVTLVPPNSDGTIALEAVAAAIRPDTAFLSIQLANNETGVLQPVDKIGRIAHAHRLLFHCDAVQGFGHLPIDPRACHIDLLSASAHKLYGPRGVGFLYIRQGIAMLPLLAGGGQENGRRSGTENIAAIEGFRVAAELANQDISIRAVREENLRELLLKILQKKAPGITELAAGTRRVPSITALLLPGVDSEEMIARLDLRGIRISGGAACGSLSENPSHVYTAMGMPDTVAKQVIRISTGRHTTPEDIFAVVEAMVQVLQKHG